MCVKELFFCCATSWCQDTQEKKSKDLLSNVTHRSFSLMSNQYERSRANQLFLFIELTLAMSSSSFFYSTSSFFDMPHVTSSFTNQSSSEFWLDVTRLSPADGNVIAVFFLLLHPFFGLSAGSFYHDFNKRKKRRNVSVNRNLCSCAATPGFCFHLEDLYIHRTRRREREKKKTSSKTSTWIELLPLFFFSLCMFCMRHVVCRSFLFFFFFLSRPISYLRTLSFFILYLVVENTRQHSVFCLFSHAYAYAYNRLLTYKKRRKSFFFFFFFSCYVYNEKEREEREERKKYI